MYKKYITIFNIFLVISFSFFPLFASALGLGPKTPSVGSVLQDLGFEKSAVNNAAKTFNVSAQKRTPPKVDLVFNPADPVEGEEFTATAVGTYFMNESKHHYYTWFIKRGICKDPILDYKKVKDGECKDLDLTEYECWEMTEKRKPDNGNFTKCDLNKDDTIDIEDYKIYAMRLVANGGFNWQKAQDIDESYVEDDDPDNDYYLATFGGDDQRGKPKRKKGVHHYCFAYDINKGNDYPIECDHHLFPLDYEMDNNGNITKNGKATVAEPKKDGPLNDDDACIDLNGDEQFKNNRELFWRTDPYTMDTARTGTIDEATVAGLGKSTVTWTYRKGDSVGVAVEGIATEATQQKDSSYKIMWALSKPDFPAGSNMGIQGKPEEKVTDKVDEIKRSYLIVNEPSSGPPSSDPYTKCSTITNQSATVTIIDQTNTFVTLTTVITTKKDITCITTIPDDDDPDDLPTITTKTWTDISTETREEEVFDLEVGHGPVDNGSNDTVGKVTDYNKYLYKSLVSPAINAASSKRFDITLTYNPENPVKDNLEDPSINVNSDGENEADILEIQSSILNNTNKKLLLYQWDVQGGDSYDTDEWKSYTKPQLIESTQTVGLGLDKFSFKLNFPNYKIPSTYEDKYKDPNYLKISLTVSENTKELGNPVLGKNQFTRETVKSIIIPLYKKDDSIQVYPVSITSPEATPPLHLSLEKTHLEPDPSNPGNYKTVSSELCFEDKYKIVCPVFKNQIVGMELNPKDFKDFIWTLDEEPFSFKECFFDGCENAAKPDLSGIKQTNAMYFPVLKEKGKRYQVNLTATRIKTKKTEDPSSIEEKINLSRVFEVVDPEIEIVDAFYSTDPDGIYIQSYDNDNCAKSIIGRFIDIKEKKFFDFSNNKLNTKNSIDPIKIKAQTKIINYSRLSYIWVVDGTTEPNSEYDNNPFIDGTYKFEDHDNILVLPIKPAGETYTISVSTLYTPSFITKQALNKYWDVSYNQFYEKNMSANATIEIYCDNCTAMQKNDKKIFASIYSSAPTYLAFLFRLVLTVSIIIFTAKIIFSFFPERD